MRAIAIPIEARFGEPLYISVLSDLHIDSELCDIQRLRQIAAERRELPNHRAIIIGDVADLVLPPDLRRFRPSGRPADIATRDDYLMASLDRCIELLRDLGLQYDVIGAGNHEDEVLKRHGIDPTSVICHALGAHHGGYAGVVQYSVNFSGSISTLTIAYHHGAWGGRYAKGYLGARDWFDHIDGWDIACYGHCHASRVDPELRYAMTYIPRRGEWRLQRRRVYLVNCASFVNLDTYGGTHYTERHGYPPQPIAPPLIKVVWTRRKHGGVRTIERHISVEV